MMRMSVLKMNLWKTKIFTHQTVTAESILIRDGTIWKIDRRMQWQNQQA